VVRTDIFAQASLSRLGENSISSPWYLLELSLKRRASVLCDESSRSGEKVSLKREPMETCSVQCSSPLAWARLVQKTLYWSKLFHDCFIYLSNSKYVTIPIFYVVMELNFDYIWCGMKNGLVGWLFLGMRMKCFMWNWCENMDME